MAMLQGITGVNTGEEFTELLTPLGQRRDQGVP